MRFSGQPKEPLIWEKSGTRYVPWTPIWLKACTGHFLSKTQGTSQLTFYYKTELALSHFTTIGSNAVVPALIFKTHPFDVKSSIGVFNKPFLIKLVSTLLILAPADLGFRIPCCITVKPEIVVHKCCCVLWSHMKNGIYCQRMRKLHHQCLVNKEHTRKTYKITRTGNVTNIQWIECPPSVQEVMGSTPMFGTRLFSLSHTQQQHPKSNNASFGIGGTLRLRTIYLSQLCCQMGID